MNSFEAISNLSNFFSRLKKHKPLRVVLAYSGGLDSSTLLFLLNQVPSDLIEIVGLAHVNHNLRIESANDATFAEEVALKYRIPFFILDICPLRLDVTNEAWGRDVRYRFFDELLVQHKLDYVLTAHHLDDEIETFIFRLILGRNNPSLSLIREVDEARKILRPLLKISKTDLLEIARDNDVRFIEDKSNEDSKYARNYIRNEVLPGFEKINPSYRNSIAQFIHSTREDCELILDDPRIIGNAVSIETLISYSDPLALRGLIALVREQIGDTCEAISTRRYKDLLQILRNGVEGEKQVDLGGGLTAVLDMRDHERPLEVLATEDLKKRSKQISKHQQFEKELKLNQTIIMRCPIQDQNIFITLKNCDQRDSLGQSESDRYLVESFGLRSSQNCVLVRGTSECEFLKVAASSRKRVSRLLKESKLPRRVRSSLLYISEEDELLWIPTLDRRGREFDEGLEKISISVRYEN